MNDLASQPQSLPDPLEVKLLGELLADAFRHEVEKNRWHLNLSPDEAVAKANEALSPAETQKILDCPAPEVRWRDIQRLAAQDTELALRRWEEIKTAARENLQSGYRGAFVHHGHCDAWKLAEHLAILHQLTEAWQPRNGAERLMIDQMALAHAQTLFWNQQLDNPRQYDIEQVGAMVERFNKMFLRTVRAFAELRKQPLAVIVQNAKQVNVGNQQVNVAS